MKNAVTIKEQMDYLRNYNAELHSAAISGRFQDTQMSANNLPADHKALEALLILDNFAHHYATLIKGRLSSGQVSAKYRKLISDDTAETIRAHNKYAYNLLYPSGAAADLKEPLGKGRWMVKPWICSKARTEPALRETGMRALQLLIPIVYGDRNGIAAKVLEPITTMVFEVLLTNSPAAALPSCHEPSTLLDMSKVPTWLSRVPLDGDRAYQESLPVSVSRIPPSYREVVLKAIPVANEEDATILPRTPFVYANKAFMAKLTVNLGPDTILTDREAACLV